MENFVLYTVNIAIEATLIFVLAIMLFTLLWQRKTFPTTIPLFALNCFIIFNLVVQIITWWLFIGGAPATYGIMPMRIVYTLDYFFSYCSSAAFYFYVEALVTDGYQRNGINYKPKISLGKIVIWWGILTTVFYFSMLFVPSIYRIEGGETVFSVPAYVFMHIFVNFAGICAVVVIFIHRKVIGRREAALSYVFLFLISVFSVVDELLELCIGHVFFAAFTLVLYVSVDLHKGILLERQERELVESKTQIMLSQMQPHFLYNVLTTISSLCEAENALQARDVVNRFADYFRANLDSIGKEKLVPFEKELEHVKTYLWLEKVRFEDALNIRYEIGSVDFLVPSLTIQPMVENAVKHGILPKEDGGTVVIKTCESELEHEIVIEDDGIGFDIDEIAEDDLVHVGIENVSRRLELVCNGSCEIHSKKGEGTVVTIHIPKGE